jgi:hypothetical protein
MNVLEVRPQKNKLFGVTHDRQGNAVLRVPRAVKIGIGVPAGKDVEVYMDFNRTWVIRAGEKANRYANRADAQAMWAKALEVAGNRSHPKKLDYFTFTKPGAVDYDPDWDAIEQHGPRPTEIDIVFVDNDPAHFAFEWWATTELKCHGDGINAMRSFSLARTDEEKKLVAEAKAAGMDKFPIIGRCFSSDGGCEYAKKQCKPVGQLNFQLVSTPRLGSTAYFHTTSFRSVVNLASNLEQFRMMTGGGNAEHGFVAGIPLKLVLRRHKVQIEDRQGKKSSSHAFNVALEFRAESAVLLRQKMLETGLEYQRLSAPPKQLAAPAAVPPADEDAPVVAGTATGAVIEDDGEDFTEAPAAAIANEFYPEGSDDEDFGEGKTSGSATAQDKRVQNQHGSEEAAKAVAALMVEWQKAGRTAADVKLACNRFTELIEQGEPVESAIRQVKAEDLANADPTEPRDPKAPPAEELVNESQVLDMLTFAQDELRMSANEVRQIFVGKGFTGSLNAAPLRIFKDVWADLKRPKAVDDPQPPQSRGKKQRSFSL